MAKSRNKRQLARLETAGAAIVNTRAQQHGELQQQAYGTMKKMYPQHQASLLDRMTRDDQIELQSQQRGEAQASQEHGGAKKRKRGETDNGAQQQKRKRINTNFNVITQFQGVQNEYGGRTVALENTAPSAKDLRTLQHMSDEQKMAHRRDRFANASIERRIDEASKTTRSNRSSAAHTRNTHEERKMAEVEKAVAANPLYPNAHGDNGGSHDQDGVIVGEKYFSNMDVVGESTPAKSAGHTIHQTANARSDSVLQSSPPLTANSQKVGDIVDQKVHNTPLQHSPSPDQKNTAKGRETSDTVNLDTGALHNAQKHAAQTKPIRLKMTIQKLQAPRVVINDNRQPIVESNPEYVLEYKPYDFTSVLLMASFNIMHDEKAEGSVDRWYKSNQILNRQAMDMYKRPWTSQDLGRKTVDKTLPTYIINDCDLYFGDDQKIYIATEMGLLLVAEYCKAIGVPDEQAVRFEGRKPKWVKKLEADRHYRRVELYHPQNKDSYLQPCISLELGSTVEIYERREAVDAEGIAWDFAYGRRTEDGVRGFFDYGHTCRMDWGMDPGDEVDAPDPSVIDWGKFDYGPGARNARTYMAVMTAGRYAPQPQGQSSTVIRATAATGDGLGTLNTSTTPTVVGSMALTGLKAAATAPASPATTNIATFAPLAIQEQSHESVILAEAAAAASIETPDISLKHTVGRSAMLSVAGRPMDHCSQDSADAANTDVNNDKQDVSQVTGDVEELGSTRCDSHTPIIDRNGEDVKTNNKTEKAAHSNVASDVSVAPSAPSPLTISVGTIRRRVGPNEYVEDEIDYDDDEL
ncbi:hypothetical protein T440DRAFT_532646 [Plenodomus tracheiphilus IPT5]|uniref:Uncharacterized protein n=1 Tax=Plenodomus tracheiphilus IPT5 TaxID=1408161 RepID=A0A6A7B4G8_9PLEO|nr:hypothetical protein T440DRAFT_532646 [Plenodomus tracheiphilus IPT5]